MLLPVERVRPTPKVLRLIPFFENVALGIFPNTYFPPDIARQLVEGKASIDHLALLAHELTHVERQKKGGPLLFFILYFLIPKFMIEEELYAFAAQMRYYKDCDKPFPIKHYALILSSSLYFHRISYEEAFQRLTDLWQNC